MKKVYFLAISLLVCALSQIALGQSTTFFYTGAVQTYSVPPGVTIVGIDAKGGGGGAAYDCCTTQPNAKGGRVQCTLNVTPGTTYYVYVGGAGQNWVSSGYAIGGFNGGGNGGSTGSTFSAAGGGGTDIRTSASGTAYTGRLVVAGGAGGGGDFDNAGGSGGGTTGGSGVLGACGGGPTGPSCTTGTGLGTFGAGGAPNAYSMGGGGGGWYGGNGGVNGNGGGGGGSSYTDPVLASGAVHTQGYVAATGSGQMIITVLCNSPGTIVGSNNVCVGSVTTLTDPTSVAGGTWSSSNTAVATINSTSGVVTGVSPGTSTITYTVSNPCGALATATITVNPLPGTISGSTNVCVGATSTLTSSTPGGTWASSNTSQATVGSASGVLGGVSAGTPFLTYTLPTGCNTVVPVTVNNSPAAITGSTTVCPGGTTILSDATSGGTWTSSNTALATIGSTTGVVTGVAGGFPTVTYTSSVGCTATTVLTVYSMNPIVGVLGMCSLGATTTLTDATSGGTWTSSNTSVATIGSTTGVLTSVGYGTTTISYTVGSTGCVATAVEGVTTTAGGTFTMTGGGNYCAGGTGVTVGLSGSTSGVSYQLFNGFGPVGAAIAGAGFPISFGLQLAGSYYVVADYGSSCALTMTGTATVGTNALPTQFTVSGGGAYCAGGTGVHIFLNSSTIGVSYQLFLGLTPVGSPISGTSAALDFGLQTATGTYTIVGTNTTTGCVNGMANSVTISTNVLPAIFTVTPSAGGYCAGGTGASVGLSGSVTGTNYALYYGGTATGAVVAGTGSAISFGLQTAAGVYTVVATNGSGCTSNMAGASTITINALPTVFSVTGGGAYCSGGTGVHIGLAGSQSGVNYQLYNGITAVGSAQPGSGAAIDFGTFTTTGSYTVVATNPTTGCTMNMTGSAFISITPLPTSFTVTGGGSYCAGGAGLSVGLSGSVSGTNYALYNGTTLVGGASGTGAAISFGPQTAAGTYTVVATNTITGCNAVMSGSVTIVINALPTVFSVTGGGAYCAGGTGMHIGLSGSQSGVSYTLFFGGVVSGTAVSGTGTAIDFGLRTGAGSYTVVATNTSTTCTNNMTGSVSISINPLPTVFTVTGGNPYCAGGTGSLIGLSSSSTGFTYQLFNGLAVVGAPVSGTGAPISFGLQTLTGTYSVVATNTSTGCTATMSGTPTISILPLPTAFTVTGSGSYCAGGAGVNVLLSSSATGINYQLLRGTTTVGTPMAGSGFPLDFGAQTVAGTYFVVATNATTGCTNNMTSSAVITINPLPTAFAFSGGGSYCAGGAGMHVLLTASTAGISYQLFNGFATVGAPVIGSGSAIDFGLQTAAGTYTVVGTNTGTGCSNNMTGSLTISINPLPTLHTLTGGGNYCFGTPGSDIGLNGSETGNNYQLMLGGTPAGAPIAGTGSSLDFGMLTASGTYTIVATNATTGCSVNMVGSTNVGINPLPTLHGVTGGGNYCPGGAGVHVGLSTSDAGISYQLFNGTATVGTPMAGTGLPLDFGLKTATGTYTVVATNSTTGCTSTMTGSVTIGISPLPAVYSVTGGGNFCPSGFGVHIGLSGSNLGISYQLMNGTSLVGASVSGTGLPLDFGLFTAPGTYTVVAASTVTTCTNNMSGSAVVGISALPAVHVVTGGGNYCPGGTGVHIGLDVSELGSTYQLYKDGVLVGTAVAGTGSAIDFGSFTASGTYTVIAKNGPTCAINMTGSATVGLYPLPVAYNVSGGGNYCAGSTGMHITLSGSIVGTNYQLFNGTTPVGSPVAGTGALLDFGAFTGAGTYTVVASDATTGCTANMTGSATIGINALPNPYPVTGGGTYCAGGAGLHVMLGGSNTGITYQLFNTSGPVGGPLPGTGSALDFGIQTTASTYFVVATNSVTGCTNNMTGSVTIGTSPLPTAFVVSSTASNYCAGGLGVDISLSGSTAGVSYQLLRAGSPVGAAMAGTGAAIDFGYNTLAGTYTVVASNNTTGCTRSMTSSITVIINPLPAAFTITGGGNFCAGGTGVTVGLSGSNSGILYQLYLGSSPVGSPVSGTGSAISFGAQTGAGTYHVVATNPGTSCTNMMSGTVNIGLNTLPTPYTVTGGGAYCAGGSGIDLGLSSSSAGVNYQLVNGSTPVGSLVAGSGSALDFGNHLAAGTYTVMATNATTSCTNSMAGSATIDINPAPTTFTVTGGGNFCAGGTGVHVGLSGSNSGITYQLFDGTSPSGSPLNGSGLSLDFGTQTAAGAYTIVATDNSTGCTGNMSGAVNVGINPLPALFNVTGGGNYCASGSGVHVMLNGSAIGINYQLYNGAIPTGSAVPGNGGILDMGLQTAAGTYTVIATNATTGCSRTMGGSTSISITPLVTPAVSIASSGPDTICSGTFTTFTANPVNGGTSPTYSWSVNGVSITASGNSYAYIPVNGDVLSVTMTTSASCVSSTTASASKTMNVVDEGTPTISISADPGRIVCSGTAVTFTATSTFGGSSPVYTWFKGITNIGSGPSVTYTPANGDDVYSVLTSNYRCRTTNSASSAHITMQVDVATTPVVTVTMNTTGTIMAGQPVSFTATATNAGATPNYQWTINGVAVPGATLPTFVSSTLNNGDNVCCQVTSGGGCPGTVGSACSVVHISGVGVKPVVSSGSDFTVVPNPNKGTFTLKGTIAAAYDEEVTLEVTNMLGQVVYTGKVMSHNGTIDEKVQLGNNPANGMYLLNIRSGAGNNVFHIVVEQ